MNLYNTMSGKIEELAPADSRRVSIYTCGPTVYDTAHIGNLRKYLCDDILVRTLMYFGYGIDRVMNMTDIDDKTIKRADGVKADFEKLTQKYENLFLSDTDSLNIIRPNKITRATLYIKQMLLFVDDLLKKGFAYQTADGSVYFSLAKFSTYGQLSKLDQREIKVGARIDSDEYDKENPSDFALWKAWDETDGEIYWDPKDWLGADTKILKGRPGWHLECSTMSTEELGETIDIHTGGVDNIFPHHENEIAQSEARSGKQFVRHWVHSDMLMVDGRKMSKSLNNFYRLADIVAKGFSPLDFRYFLLGAHYRSKINFTWEAMNSAKNSRLRLVRLMEEFKNAEKVEADQSYLDRFESILTNDIDLPSALAVLWEVARDEKVSLGSRYSTILKFDKIFGLDLDKDTGIEAPSDITLLADDRRKARENKDFARSDEIRDELLSHDWIIEDLPNNQYKLFKK
ncbi:MAG: cysteine--tRNA ligase [Candidatus Berkelbacteria bacterium]